MKVSSSGLNVKHGKCLTKWTSIRYNITRILQKIINFPDSWELNVHAHYYPCSVYQAVFFCVYVLCPLCCVHEKYSAGDEAYNQGTTTLLHFTQPFLGHAI